jgi:hypothetical protein
VSDYLKKNDEFNWRIMEAGNSNQKRPIALRPPNLDLFSGEEIAIVDQWIEKCWGLSATEISLKSHGFIGWEVTPFKQTIPYGTVLVSNRNPSDREHEFGLSLAAKAEEWRRA